jgi:hypothetical protein
MVTAQLIYGADQKKAQWDGVVGGDATPSTAWVAGQIIRQDIPLAIDPAAPPGNYRLLIAVYAPDGTLYPIDDEENIISIVEVPER